MFIISATGYTVFLINSCADELFVQHDTCATYGQGHPDSMKILATNHGLDKLRSSLDWGADGTFHSAPSNFEQVFIVGVMVRTFLSISYKLLIVQESHLFTPCVYAFLTGKSTRSYEAVFEWLSQQGIPAPLTIMSGKYFFRYFI